MESWEFPTELDEFLEFCVEDRPLPFLTFSAGNVGTVLHMAGAQWRLRRNLQAAWITYLLEEFDQARRVWF